MYSRHGVQLQIGGSDQYGNIIAGMDAIKYISSSQSPLQDEINPIDAPYGITVPLLTTSSGAKFGKSAGNAVWLDPDMTSPFDLYGVCSISLIHPPSPRSSTDRHASSSSALQMQT